MIILKALVDFDFKKFDIKVEKDKIYILPPDFVSEALKDGFSFESILDFELPKIYEGDDLTDKKIFISHGFALGDTVQMSPFIKYLKQRFKNVFIGVESYRSYSILKDLKNDGYIDEIIYSPVDIESIKNYDYFMNLYYLVGSTAFDKNFVGDMFFYLSNLEPPKDKKPVIHIDEEKYKEIKLYIEELNTDKKPVLIIHPFASSPNRNVPIEILDPILNYAKDKYFIVMSYDKSKKDYAKKILGRYPFINDLSNVVKDISYIPSYVKAGDFLISAETLLPHIAATTGTKTLVILGAGIFDIVYGYNVKNIKYYSVKYSGIRCSSPCQIHVAKDGCPEMVELKKDFPPCLIKASLVEPLEIFKSLEDEKYKPKINELNTLIKEISVRQLKEYAYSDPVSFVLSDTLKNFIASFIYSFLQKEDKIYFFSRERDLWGEFFKEYGFNVAISPKEASFLVVDISYDNFDFESFKDKKIIVLSPNKNRVYNKIKRGIDIFYLLKPLNELSKEELYNLLKNYFNKVNVFEFSPTQKEFNLCFGSSVLFTSQKYNDAFFEAFKEGSSYIFGVCNLDINKDKIKYITTYTYDTLLFFKERHKKFREKELFTRQSPKNFGFMPFSIERLCTGKGKKVLLLTLPKNTYSFYKNFKELGFEVYKLFIGNYTEEYKKSLINSLKSSSFDYIVLDSLITLRSFKEILETNKKVVIIDEDNPYFYFEYKTNKRKEDNKENSLRSVSLDLKNSLYSYRESFSKEQTLSFNLDEKSIIYTIDRSEKEEEIIETLKDFLDIENLYLSYENIYYFNTDKKVIENLNKDFDFIKAFYIKPFYDEFLFSKAKTKPNKDILFYSEELLIREISSNTVFLDLFNKKLNNFKKYTSKLLKELNIESEINRVWNLNYDYITGASFVLKTFFKKMDNIGKIDLYDEELTKLALFTKDRFFPQDYIFFTHLNDLFSSYNITFYLSKISNLDGVSKPILEIFASGGFCLTDYKPSLKDIFGDIYELISFYNLEDAREKALYFLENKEELFEVKTKAFQKIKNFTFKKALENIFNSNQYGLGT